MIPRRFSLESICFKLLLWSRHVLFNHSSFNWILLVWCIWLNGSTTYIEPWFFLESHAQYFILNWVSSITWNLIVLYLFDHFALIIVLDVGAKCIKRVFLESINDLACSLLQEVLHWTRSHEGIADIQQKAKIFMDLWFWLWFSYLISLHSALLIRVNYNNCQYWSIKS